MPHNDELIVIAIIAAAIRAGTPILLATLGEIITERAGVLNVGIEGMMLTGALGGFASYQKCVAGGIAPDASLWIGIAAGMACGGLMALIHAFLTITTRANQVVSGLALTLFGAGITGFLGKPFVGIPAQGFAQLPLPLLSRIPFIGPAFFNHTILVYISYLLVPLTWFFLFKTRPGLNLRSVGESPRTADCMGIAVVPLRYLYTIIGGLFCGCAGAYLSLAYTPGWTEQMTGGRGWIAIAIVIFAGWNPPIAAFGAYLFGGISGIQMRIQAAGTSIPANLLLMLPYIFTIIVLLLGSGIAGKRVNMAPRALGLPYVREERE
jgi:general nucleoside transport system permease protein